MDLKETDILGARIGGHWYYRSKARAMQRMLGDREVRTILDVGAGSGFFSRYLLEHSTARDAWCVDTSYPEDSDDLACGKPIRYRLAIDRVDADLVLLMDVLEHVDDDVGLLRSYVDRVPRGSRFLVSVPAFQALWSDHDVFLEHRRRYRLGQIEAVGRAAGLVVDRGSYFFGLVSPIAVATRLAGRRKAVVGPPRSQLKMHHPLVNAALRIACDVELPLMRFNRLAGLSAFFVGTKR